MTKEIDSIENLTEEIVQREDELSKLRERKGLLSRRADALSDVLELIAEYGLTRAECESPTWLLGWSAHA